MVTCNLGLEVAKRGKSFGFRSSSEEGTLFSIELTLHFQSFNPGNLKTELQRHSKAAFNIFLHLMSTLISILMLHTPIHGAYTELYAGLSPDLTIEKDQGIYVWPWGRRGFVRPDIAAECKAGGNSEKLYEWCERETGKWT
jgi:retinol dehydrogenase-12